MTNAEKFQEVFGVYATEMWAMPEQDFLKWLNADTPQTESLLEARDLVIEWKQKHDELFGRANIPQMEKPKIRKRIDKPFRGVWVDGDHNEIGTPQTDIHDLTDCDFCKDRNCKDCEGGKDEPQTEEPTAQEYERWLFKEPQTDC